MKRGGNSINIDLQTISGYNHYHCTRAKDRSGSGTSLYLKKSIPFKPRPDLELKKNMFKSSVIEIEKNVMNSKCNIIVGILYRSPNSSLSAFNDELDKMFGIIQKEKKYACILGDFNVNTLNELTGLSLDSQTFINLFSAHYYRKLIDVPTRVVENSSTLLDNVYTNCSINESSGVIKTDITDHYSSFTVRDHLEPIKDSKHRDLRNFSIKNIFRFKKSLKQVNWNFLYEQGTQAVFSNFCDTTIELVNHHFPLQKIEIKYYNKNPWISKEPKKK